MLFGLSTSWYVKFIVSLVLLQFFSTVIFSPLIRFCRLKPIDQRYLEFSEFDSILKKSCVKHLYGCFSRCPVLQLQLNHKKVIWSYMSSSLSSHFFHGPSERFLTRMQSIWFSIVSSGKTHVTWCMRLWGQIVPLMIILLKGCRFASLSPFLLLSPSPCCPMISSCSVVHSHLGA